VRVRAREWDGARDAPARCNGYTGTTTAMYDDIIFIYYYV